jgi:D123
MTSHDIVISRAARSDAVPRLASDPRSRANFGASSAHRKLAGISQYHFAGYDECWHRLVLTPFADIFARREERKEAITAFIGSELIPHLPVDDLVTDLWIDHSGKITLIEINPYGLSDPCLFTYSELDGCDGEFRFVPPATQKEVA